MKVTCFRSSLGALVCFMVISCGGTQQQPMVRRQVSRMENTSGRQDDRSRCDTTQPNRAASEYDTDSDGVPDVRKVYETVGEGGDTHSVLVCREVDLNHDGMKDMVRFYNDVGRTVREEEDRNFDGKIDVVTYFDNGEVVRREFDLNGDGKVDMRTYYRERHPYRSEREIRPDNSAEFKPDYWEFYNAQGAVVRIGQDFNGDGRADQWDRIDRIAPVRAAQTSRGDGGAEEEPEPAMTPTIADGGVRD